jgi:hypothetical protein
MHLGRRCGKERDCYETFRMDSDPPRALLAAWFVFTDAAVNIGTIRRGKADRAREAVNLMALSNVNVRRSQGQIRRVVAPPDCSLRSPASEPEAVRISR